jgi:hypothetical protein
MYDKETVRTPDTGHECVPSNSFFQIFQGDVGLNNILFQSNIYTQYITMKFKKDWVES